MLTRAPNVGASSGRTNRSCRPIAIALPEAPLFEVPLGGALQVGGVRWLHRLFVGKMGRS
jgi:hypothetical protein